ncbi:MAG: hypothetical protein ACOYJV_01705 [Aminivibrio sp.]
MPTLREQIRRDVEDGAVWWNEDEFADWHDVNGKRILCVFCSDKRMGEYEPRKISERPEGVHVNRGVLFLRAGDALGVPRRGQKIRVDGRLYTVIEARLIGGAAMRIELEANEP